MNERGGDPRSPIEPGREPAGSDDDTTVPDTVERFTVSERAVHWLLAFAFFSLLISGVIVGRRGTFHDVMYAWHLASAAAS